MTSPTYHNPDNLPSPGEGWRFLEVSELDQPLQEKDEVRDSTDWFPTLRVGKLPWRKWTYRRPLQTLPSQPQPSDGEMLDSSEESEDQYADMVPLETAQSLERQLAQKDAALRQLMKENDGDQIELESLRRQLAEVRAEVDEARTSLRDNGFLAAMIDYPGDDVPLKTLHEIWHDRAWEHWTRKFEEVCGGAEVAKKLKEQQAEITNLKAKAIAHHSLRSVADGLAGGAGARTHQNPLNMPLH